MNSGSGLITAIRSCVGMVFIWIATLRDLQESAELLRRESGVVYDSRHRISVHRIVTRNRHKGSILLHHNVLALTHNSEPRLLQSPDGSLVRNAGDPTHFQMLNATSRTSSSDASSRATET
jgi:hypothetical protein